jgi:hypothetical protein
MTKWVGAALLAATLTLAFLPAVSSAGAAPGEMRKAQTPQATDFSARRYDRHYHRYGYRPLNPHYYGRPDFYAPLPILPIPPFFGYGWEWW